MGARRPSPNPPPQVRPERTGAATVELISIGKELLRGRMVDANASSLARSLTQRGARIHRITVVDDREESIERALREALERNPNLVVLTGGLGPAGDDRTLAAVAQALGVPLQNHTGARPLVEAAYSRMREQGKVLRGGMTAWREKLCALPIGSDPVVNPKGLAPGVICRLAGGAAVVCLPGTPREMQAVFELALEQLTQLSLSGCVAQREIESPTADEAALRPLLDGLAAEFPDLWINSHPGGGRKRGRITIHIEATAATLQEAEQAVDDAVRRLLTIASTGS